MATELLPAQSTGRFPLDRGYLFSGNGIGREVDANTAVEWLKHRDDSSTEFIWLHFHDIPTVLQGWPLQHVQLPEAFGDTLREAPARHESHTSIRRSSPSLMMSNTTLSGRRRSR
jgi:zinc transporter